MTIISNRSFSMNAPKYVLVMSGKGGVGKSTTAANIARSLALKLGKVGLLDLDLTGPSIPTIFGVKGQDIKNRNGKMIPHISENVEIISLGLLLSDPNDAVIWRGPRKHSMISNFFDLIEWTSSVVVVDLPPGTSDEHLSTFDILKKKGLQYQVVIVTTPNILAVADVRKGINLCRQVEAPIVGIVENFSGVMCPCCDKVSPLLGHSAAEEMSEDFNIPILAKIPFVPAYASSADHGQSNQSFMAFFNPVIEMIQQNQ